MNRTHKYCGILEGVVIANDDPSDRCRVKVRIQGIHDDEVPVDSLPWAECGAYPYTGNDHGELRIPNLDSHVFVIFRQGDPSHPVWVGQPLYNNQLRNTDEHARINGNHRQDVKLDSESNVFGSRVERVGGEYYHYVNRSSTTDVEGDYTLNVKGTCSTSYGGLSQYVTGDLYYNAAAGFRASLGGSANVELGSDLSLAVGGGISITASSLIELQSALIASGSTAIHIQSSNGPTVSEARSSLGVTGGWQVLDPLAGILGGKLSFVSGDSVVLGSDSKMPTTESITQWIAANSVALPAVKGDIVTELISFITAQQELFNLMIAYFGAASSAWSAAAVLLPPVAAASTAAASVVSGTSVMIEAFTNVLAQLPKSLSDKVRMF